MAIQINTRQTASQQELPLEAFGYNDRPNPALEASANLTGTIVGSLDKVYTTLKSRKKEADRLAAAAQKEFEAKAKAADTTLLNNAEHLANDNINVLEAEYQNAIKMGTVDDEVTMPDGTILPSIKERWAAANPRGSNYKLEINGTLNDPSRQGAYVDNIASNYTTKSLALTTKQNTRVIVDQVLDASDNVGKTIYNTIQTAPFSMIDQAGSEKILASIINFGEMAEKQALSADGRVKHNSMAQAYTEKYFLHQIGNATTEADVKLMLNAYEAMDANYEWISPTDITVRTAAKNAIKEMKTVRFAKLQEEVQAPYNEGVAYTKSLLSGSPTDPINQEVLVNQKTRLDSLIAAQESVVNSEGKSLFTDSEEQKLRAASAFLSLYETNKAVPTTSDSSSPENFEKFSIAQNEVMLELQKLVGIPNYVLSNTVPSSLEQFEDYSSRYVASRKRMVNYLYDGLIEGKDRRVLNVITTDVEEQNEILERLGIEPRNLANLSDLPLNMNEPTGVASYVVDTMDLNQGNLASVAALGYNMASAEKASDNDVLLGELLMMAASDDSMDRKATSVLVEKFMNFVQVGENYTKIVPLSIRQRIDRLDPMPHFEAQRTILEKQGKSSAMLTLLEKGIYATAYEEYTKVDERKTDLNDALDDVQYEREDGFLFFPGDIKYEDGKKVQVPRSKISVPGFDKFLRDNIATKYNDILDRIGYTATAVDYDTKVYIPPSVYRAYVQKDFDMMEPGLIKDLYVNVVDPIGNAWKSTFGNEYQTTLDDVAERVYEVNMQAMVEDPVFDIEEKMIPTIVAIAERSDDPKTIKKAEKLRDRIKAAKNNDEIIEELLSATVTVAGGEEVPAFNFGRPSAKDGQFGTQLQYYDTSVSKYMPITYQIGTKKIPLPDGTELDVPITRDYVVPTSKVKEIIEEDGLYTQYKDKITDFILPSILK